MYRKERKKKEKRNNQVSLTSPVFGPELVQFSFLVLLVLQQLGEIFGRVFVARSGGENDVAVDGRSSHGRRSRKTLLIVSYFAAIQLDHVVNQLELVVDGPGTDGVVRTIAAGFFQLILAALIQFACGLCHRRARTWMLRSSRLLSGRLFFNTTVEQHRRRSGTGWWARRQDTGGGRCY